MTQAGFGLQMQCTLTTERVYPENETPPGFSPPTPAAARPRGAQALPAGHTYSITDAMRAHEGTGNDQRERH